MKMWKRCFISLKRHPFQTALKMLIVFILGNFLFADIAIQQASVQVREKMVQRIPADVTMQLMNDNLIKILEDKPYALVEDLKANENVLNVYTQTTMNLFVFEENHPHTRYQIIGLDEAATNILDYDFVDGRHLTQEEIDNGEAKVVLHKYLASQLSLKVGDTLSLPVYDYKIYDTVELMNQFQRSFEPVVAKTYDFEVIGIFSDYAIKDAYESGGDLFEMSEIEVPMKIMQEMRAFQDEILQNHSERDKDRMKDHYEMRYLTLKPHITYIRTAVKGIDGADRLLEDIDKNPNYLKGYYVTRTSADEYRYVQAPLENLVQLSNITLWGSAILVIVLLSLISILFLRERLHEIGIFMAMGERKRNIVGQFVLEILIAGMLAVSVAMVSGNALGRVISEQFIKMQIDVDSEQEYLQLHPEAVTQLDLVDDYEVKLDAQYVITIFVASNIILLLSSAVPVLYVLRIQPKKVLM